jgi:hypothetical protein
MEQGRLSEAIKIKQEMIALTSSPGWKRLQEISRVQVEGRTNSILLNPTENAYAQEYLKGEIQGMKTLLAIPLTLTEDASAIIDSTKEESSE